jgi:TonB family protein
MKFSAILHNQALTNATRRVIFSLLSVWLHFAILFYVTMVLFARGENGPNQALDSLRREEKKITVALRQPAPVTPIPTPDATPTVDAPKEMAVPSPKEKEVPSPKEKEVAPPKEPEPPVAATKPAEATHSEGILNCADLTKKPEQIASGESFMQIKAIDSTSGSAILRERINREGIVIDVQVESSTMTKKLEEQVVASAYHTVFSPGQMGNVPVDCTIRFKVSSDDAPAP